ncbi:MAG: elongation factor P--(R)-beta-lysine ligase [Alteromonadaceae bacterium]|nr:elongation factor P--(R)-beta-lysine ligase [Alteromonadaceae bacterium]
MSNKETLWTPQATLVALEKRAKLFAAIRQFFAQKNVMEVDTPALASAGVSDPHLVNFSTEFVSPIASEQQTLFLQTSPEYAMKRLLCAGSGCIYQLSKAFRNEEAGRHHNPEFTMLEWYRVGFDHWQLMDEVAELLNLTLNTQQVDRFSYQDVFLSFLELDPLDANVSELQACCGYHGFADLVEQETNRDTLLQLLFSHVVEPQIGKEKPCFIFDFPASQAALAKINEQDPRVAERFEVYFKGIELANGFHELQDATEQEKRFASDNHIRATMGIEPAKIDTHFLAALQHGLPRCAGVALGVDRLLMLKMDADHIGTTMAFPVDRC